MNKLVVASIFTMVSSYSHGAIVQRDFNGNDCSGYFGTGFDSCTVFVNDYGERIELSPAIAKFKSDEDNGDLTLSETNEALFPSIDGTEYSFQDTSSGNKTGTWVYNRNSQQDPGTRYWATKAGNGFTLHWEVADLAFAEGGACDVPDAYSLSCLDAAMVVSTASWTTPDDKNLSHITFYDTAAVPLPPGILLFGSTLLGFATLKRRNRQARFPEHPSHV